MVEKNKDKVYQSYEKIADWFDTHRSRALFEKPYLDRAMTFLKDGAKVLDIGCGMGEPIAQYFIQKGYVLTGIDGSSKMINLAKARFPQATFLVNDMRTLDLHEKFECLIAWHSFFHLPAQDQRLMFKIFEHHITLGGVLLFTAGPEAGEVWSNNGGEDLYHDSLSIEDYKQLLTDLHFTEISCTIEDKNCEGATVWMARYKG